ncbi:sugar transferase [Paenibacillus chitinolyticus]
MSKIAHICTSAISHKILADKMSVLQQAGHEVHLISSPEGYDEQAMKNSGLKLKFVQMNRKIRPVEDVRSILRMRRLIKREGYDIVHTHTAKAGIIGRAAAWLARTPVIMHTSHGLPFYEGQSKTAYTVYRTLEKIGTYFCDALASQNREDITKLQSLNAGKIVYYEGNGVDLDKLDKAAGTISREELESLKATYGVPENKTVLLMGARMEPVKDHHFLLDALALLKSQGITDFVCLLAGKGPLEKQILERIAELGLQKEVLLIGHRSDLYAFLKMADIVVLTSEKEGIPRFLMEAMAFSKPVVASDVLGTRELVRHEDTGLLVPYKNTGALAKAFRTLIENKAYGTMLGQGGRRRIEREFTEQIVVKRLETMYKELRAGTRQKGRIGRWLGHTVLRTADLAIALPLVLLLLPVYAVVGLLVRMKLGSPVLFKQKRPGRFGRPFHVYKYRTMTDKRDSSGNLLPDEVRLTAFGKLLRKLSLDEIPQLLNVIKGDMSLVGPRPLLMEYMELYTDEQKRRHWVRPGITGWAQVNGRNAISWEDKFKLDVWYVDNRSFRLYVKILLLTAVKVVRREGVSQEGQATTTKYTGSAASGIGSPS